ncbi:unnamed protein product [Cuscuta campestris]|uniref:CCHC-type domain-containing protein n=1 Tax=Cuscuta campestris TaxID=132261 RepID=A0A484M2Y0_9ASTE|nr:unnamed protein product [Cuscuta campestris]
MASTQISYAGLGEGQSTTRPPLFDGMNYTYWKERMRIYIQSTNFLLWRIIKNGEDVPMKKVGETNVPKSENEYDAQDIKKVENNAKAINIIYCAVNPDDYPKISCCSTTKEMWDKLEITYEGTDQVREAKINFLTHEYELFRMKENEKIDEMFERFSKIVNDLHALKKTYTDKELLRKILQSLTPEWRSKADAIQKSIGVTNVTIDGLRGNLKTYECTILLPSLGEQKKKWIALKASSSQEPAREESSDEDNEFGLVIKKFHKFMHKDYERKGKKHGGHLNTIGGPPKCYGCGEPFKNEKEKKPFKKHRAYISWGGDSGDESSEGEENERANLCLMEHEEPPEEESPHVVFVENDTRLARKVSCDDLVDSLENIYLNDNDEGNNSKEGQDEEVEPPMNEEQPQEEETPMPRAWRTSNDHPLDKLLQPGGLSKGQKHMLRAEQEEGVIGLVKTQTEFAVRSLISFQRSQIMGDMEEGASVSRPPLLRGHNYNFWKGRMRAFLKSQGGGVWRTVETGWTEPVKHSDDLSTTTVKKFEDYSRTEVLAAENNDKALNAIFGAVDATEYRLISNCVSAKEAWDILEVTHEGDEKVKTAKYQILMTQYENLRMDEQETIVEFHGRVRDLANQAARLQEPFPESKLVLKTECANNLKKKRQAFSITWSDDDTDEDQGCEESNCAFISQSESDDLVEQHMDLQEKWTELLMVNRRNIAEKNQLACDLKILKQNLEKAETNNADLKFELQKLKDYIKWMKIAGVEVLDAQEMMFKAPGDRQGIGCDSHTKTNDPLKEDSVTLAKNMRNSYHSAVKPIKSYNIKRHRRNSLTYQNYRCYYCRRWGHIKRTCQRLKNKRTRIQKIKQIWVPKKRVMVANSCLRVTPDQWLLDSGCSHHLTGVSQNLANINSIEGGNVRFGGGAQGKIIGCGILNVSGLPPIKNVWLVQGLQVNLLSISQICDQGLEVTFTQQKCRVKDKNKLVVLEGDRTTDNCYKVTPNVLCFPASKRDARLWHYRLGHLNFKDLTTLSNSDAVRGLPKIKRLEGEVCGPCPKGKQTRASHPKKRWTGKSPPKKKKKIFKKPSWTKLFAMPSTSSSTHTPINEEREHAPDELPTEEDVLKNPILQSTEVPLLKYIPSTLPDNESSQNPSQESKRGMSMEDEESVKGVSEPEFVGEILEEEPLIACSNVPFQDPDSKFKGRKERKKNLSGPSRWSLRKMKDSPVPDDKSEEERKEQKNVSTTKAKKRKGQDAATTPTKKAKPSGEAQTSGARKTRSSSTSKVVEPATLSGKSSLHNFISISARSHFTDIAKKFIIPQRNLDISDFKKKTNLLPVLESNNLFKSVTLPGSYVKKVIQEFFCNLSDACMTDDDPSFHKVFVRGKFYNFSPTVINTLLGTTSCSVVSPIDEDTIWHDLTNDLVASNAGLKAQVEYLAKQVAQLSKLKMSMVQTPEESEDEQEEDVQSEVPSPTMRRSNQEKSSSNFKVEIPTFDGKDDPNDFIEWLETIERVFDYTEVPEDKKVKLVALKFRGYASTWWTNTTTKRKKDGKVSVKTWTKMRTLLKKKFTPTHYIRENFARLQHLRQGNWSVEEYNREFEELLMRCDLQENYSQTFVIYLFGLNTQIANTVELQTFENFEELTKLALKVEAQLKKGKSSLSRGNSSYPRHQIPPPCYPKPHSIFP